MPKTWYKIENSLKSNFDAGVQRMRHTILLYFLIEKLKLILVFLNSL